MDVTRKLDAWARRATLSLVTGLTRGRRASVEELRQASVSRILVVRQDDRIGNLLFVTPLLTGLKGRFPQAEIDVVSSARFPEILAHHPAVSRQILFDRRGFRKAPLRLGRASPLSRKLFRPQVGAPEKEAGCCTRSSS